MASIIEGYSYDIFVSYRQKDNKYDGWVTEFVDNLKKELETTFKEEINVYFDINPHDGLLETHDVNESLKEKLKCLVFIPIISRIYCDPKSFAWENEFKTFVNQASKEKFGLKIKLPNGNVVSRVLPIRIHDLDSEDIKQCEIVLGGFLRGVEFIYKSPGVNRPLRSKEDKTIDNLNKTIYRDQINKVTLAIREIISGLKGEPVEYGFEPEEVVSKIKNHTLQEKSIIVLPFENISPEPDQEYFSDGLTEEVISDLSLIPNLLVISRSSAMTFKGTKNTIKEIADKVNVRYVLEGSVRNAANKLRITAQLIDAANDSHIWAEKYTGTLDDIFDIQEKVSRSIFDALKLKLSPKENDRVSERPITNVVAYQYYLQAKREAWSFNQESLDHALKLTNQALDNVGENALLYATQALIYWQYHNAGFKPIEETLQQADTEAGKALDLDPELSLGHWTKGAIAYTRGELQTAALHYKRSAELEAGGESLAWLSLIHSLAGKMHEARLYGDHATSVDPLNILTICFRGLIEIYGGDFKCAVRWLKRGLEIMPGDPMTLGFCATGLLYAGNNQESLVLLNQLANSDAGLLSSIGGMWIAAVNFDKPAFQKFSANLHDYARGDKEISWSMADCYAIMGETDMALDWLSNSIERGLINDIFFSEFDPFLSKLKNDSRFKTLMERAQEKQSMFITMNN
jgi:TolB-like protein